MSRDKNTMGKKKTRFHCTNNPAEVPVGQCTNRSVHPELSPCPALGSLPKMRRAADCLLGTGFVSAAKGNNGSQLFGASDRLTQGSCQLL